MISALIMAGILSGCTKTTNVDPDPYKAPLYMEISDSKVLFDIEGGKAVVTIATNADRWEYTGDADGWFSISVSEDSSLVVEAPINSSASAKSETLTITALKGEESVGSTLKIVQRAEYATDLSAGGTANCYVAKTNGTYKFRADIKGNGGDDGKTRYIEKEGLEIKNAVKAELLWEARNDGDRSMSYEIIDGAPSYRGGYVTFYTGRSEGNAVIAVKDVYGDILWSWHIWVTDKEITAHDHINTKGEVIAQIMDRNLGALNNDPMDINNRGMIYQMGRKDPFIPSRSPYLDYSNVVDSTKYCGNDPKDNKPNYEVGDGTGKWEFSKDFKAQPIYEAPGNIPYASAHPMRYLVSYYSSSYVWYSYASDADAATPGLWGEKKTIFDPCPAGYKVPGNNMWGEAVGTENHKTGGKPAEYDENGESSKYFWNKEKNCGRVWKPTGDFYPMVGNIYPAGESPYNYTSGQTFYLTSQENSLKEGMMYVASFNGYWAQYELRAQVYTGQVRCVKE